MKYSAQDIADFLSEKWDKASFFHPTQLNNLGFKIGGGLNHEIYDEGHEDAIIRDLDKDWKKLKELGYSDSECASEIS